MVTESREVGRDQGVVPGFATAPGSAVDEVHYSFSCFNVVFRVFRVFRVIRTFHCRRVIIQIFPPAIATATTTATAARNSLHPPPQTDEPAEDFVGVRRREEGTGEFHTKVGEETDEAGVAKVVGGPGGEEATGEGRGGRGGSAGVRVAGVSTERLRKREGGEELLIRHIIWGVCGNGTS